MVSHKGIKANPEKIQAILDMSFSKSIKDIQRLTSRIAALNRFVSKSANKCLPFFKFLRNTTRFVWDDPCGKYFAYLKAYLSSLPLLVSLEPSEKLYLYLAALEENVNAVLVK